MIWLGVLIGLILGVLLCASVERFVDLGGDE
jgi:ABC-type lipoprotein release transport system permease subunit